MQIIPVAPDLSIELETAVWRLVQDYDEGKALRTLVEATAQRVTFHADFAAQNHFPAQQVTAQQVARVVLGWMPESQNWALGLFINGGTGDLIWHELITWQSNHPQAAAQAMGQALCGILGVPFHIVGQDTNQEPLDMTQATQPSSQTTPFTMPHHIDPQPAPIDMGEWALRVSSQGIVWQPNRSWVRRHLLRAVFFAAAVLLFIFLGIGSLQSGLAPVSPDWLPWVAFGIALVLAFSALENLWRVVARQQIVIDKLNNEVRSEGMMMRLVAWRIPFEQVQYVLVSQEPAHPQGRRHREDPMQIAQNAWVHIYANAQFFLIGEFENQMGKSWQWELVRRRSASQERLPLELAEYDTPLHHAALQTALLLAVPAYIDVR